MTRAPTTREIQAALAAAGSAHHEYESNHLRGVRDEQWPGWYAAYVLGRLGDFARPTELATWLERAPGDGDWARQAADYVGARIDAARRS